MPGIESGLGGDMSMLTSEHSDCMRTGLIHVHEILRRIVAYVHQIIPFATLPLPDEFEAI